jgi:hypothetical protein
MNSSQGSVTKAVSGRRRFKSPNRILAHAFRIGRDSWKAKHHAVQAKLEQARQLAPERGASRDRWRQDHDDAVARVAAAESLAAHRLTELEHVRARLEELEAAAKKSRVDPRCVNLGQRTPGARLHVDRNHRSLSSPGPALLLALTWN